MVEIRRRRRHTLFSGDHLSMNLMERTAAALMLSELGITRTMPAKNQNKAKWPERPGLGQIVRFLQLVLIMVGGHGSDVRAESLRLTGAIVHTVSGETLAPGQVLIEGEKIMAVGKEVPANGATSVDLKGEHLYPGIISLDSVLGLIEIEAVRATADATEAGDYTPDVESWIAVNPDSELLPVARANGIAYFEPVPRGGIVSGQSGLLAMSGWTAEAMTIKRPLALHLFWPSME